MAEHVVTLNAGYLDVSGVIGSFVRPNENKCAILFATPKTLIDAWVQSVLGYSKGQLHVDHTFKLLQEEIPLIVTSVADISQHVHPCTLGPTTHMDDEMTKMCLEWQKTWVDQLLALIANSDIDSDEYPWPEEWSLDFRSALLDRYKQVVDGYIDRTAATDEDGDILVRDAPKWSIGCGMADAARAMSNAVKAVFGVHTAMCWVHVWRKVAEKKTLLRVNTEDRCKELFTDLTFLHHMSVEVLLSAAIVKFDAKWRNQHNEVVMADYLKTQWMSLLWQRAHGEPGEPSDNNTLESLNHVLKTESHFNATTSLGRALPHMLLVMHRLSRDKKEMSLVP